MKIQLLSDTNRTNFIIEVALTIRDGNESGITLHDIKFSTTYTPEGIVYSAILLFNKALPEKKWYKKLLFFKK